ncbi:DUF4331 family protein [Micromonospora sp. 067-2]|uniref:DUF4331 family protein n=1 Tax=Micromonospora sp. 067-2 TaxID=2789270 RepID=UPI00397E4B5F
MSHHLDSTEAQQDSRLDLTDQYIFAGESGTAFLMAMNSSAKQTAPGFHPEARYEFKVHLDGELTEALTYRFTFGPADASGQQQVTLHLLAGGQARDDGAQGSLLAQGRTNEVIDNGDGVRIFAATVADPFYLDLDQLAGFTAAIQQGTTIEPGTWRADAAKNTFQEGTVAAIAMEIPRTDATLTSGRRIASWAVTKLATDAGGWRQVNRCAHPMMSPIFRPADGDWANEANHRHPSEDLRADGDKIARLVQGLVAAYGTAADPAAYGHALAQRLLPDLLAYEIGSPACYGFDRHNGRALVDNAAEVMFSLTSNAAMSCGLSPAGTAKARQESFPYVVAAGTK